MVTSKGVGLAVPDWPTTFGYNMFLFPVSQWVGGIFFEHTHRLIASAVGFLTIILAVWLWRAESRKWVRDAWLSSRSRAVDRAGRARRLARHDVEGRDRHLSRVPRAGISWLCSCSSRVVRSRALDRCDSAQRVTSALCGCAVSTTIVIYLQLALGATMRHQHRDLAILDFPLAYGQVIPDVSAESLAAINQWRDAQALSNVDAGAHLAADGASLRRSARDSSGWSWYCARVATPAAPAIRPTAATLSSLWLFFLALASHARSVDDLE